MTETGSVLKTLMMLAYLNASPHGNPNQHDAFIISSPAFDNNKTIPLNYTCEGSDISPPIKWQGVPKKTKSLALVMFDEDTQWPGFYHWEVFNIPPTVTSFSPNIHTQLPEHMANNSFGNKTYRGPCPPQGEHHYVIRLYALDKKLANSAGKNPLDLHRSMEHHIIAWTQVVGHFTK